MRFRFIRELLTTAVLGATLGLWACTIALGAEVIIERYATVDEAALHALSTITEQAFEVGGVVLRDKEGRFYYTAPQGDKATDQFEIRVKYPKGHKIVAIYHTHPDQTSGEVSGEMFSPPDVECAEAYNVPSYIKVLSSGNIRKYEPGVSRTRKYRTPGQGTAKGRISEGQIMENKA